MTIAVVRREKRIIMEGSASSINSRATAIKTILLAAWRVKLSDEEWENRIRKILPRGVNGDVYDLADCLLKQALVGPVPNQLFISYLKHAVKCELVSHGAVLSSIAQQSTHIKPPNNLAPNRTSPVKCLLEFLQSFRDKISCKGTEIECLNLCRSISQLTHWLLKCILNSLDSFLGNSGNGSNIPLGHPINYNSNNNLNNLNTINSGSLNLAQRDSAISLIHLCTESIHYFIDKPFIKSLLFISKLEYDKEFEEILNTVQIIQQKLATCQNLQFIQEKVKHLDILQKFDTTFNSREMHPSVVAAHQLRCLQMHRIRSTQVTSSSNFEKKFHQSLSNHDSTTNYALFNSLYSLIASDVILRPARSHKSLSRQIAIITNLNSAPIYTTYCELIRVCMIGFINSIGTPAKVKWAFFTFLKMPKLLIELSKVFNQIQNQQDSTVNLTDTFVPANQATTPTSFISDLNLAFERLCVYSPLLDEAEYKCNCDFFKCIVKELIKNDQSLMQLRSMDFRKFSGKRSANNNNDGSVGGHSLLRTEPVVTTILQTLDSEQDPKELFSILSQLVSGKQFEFTLSAAASTGRLQIFVKKLIIHNGANTISNDPSKNSHIQALIFDITFLILAYIAQQYGSEVIGTDQRPTFNKWFFECYNPTTRIDCPKEMLKNSNDEIVTNLIKQLLRTEEGGFQIKSSNWQDVCINLPKAVNEIMIAWNQGHLSDNQIEVVFEQIKSKMCFAAVVTATWLQAYIRTLSDNEMTKPLSLLQGLTKASFEAKQQKLSNPESGLKGECYSERSSLMCSIIKKIYFELAPKVVNQSPPPSSLSNNATSSIEVDESLDESVYQSVYDRFISTLTSQEIFLANVKQCLSRGWIDHKSLGSMNSLFKMIGSENWTNLLVEQILTSHESPSDLCRAVNITFGLFHLDIEGCAFALLKDTIPSWLMGEKKQSLLSQPRAFALAHLTVMTIIEVYYSLRANQSVDNDLSPVEEKPMSLNGIKQEISAATNTQEPFNVGRDVKRIKLSADVSEKESHQGVNERLNKFHNCIADLMKLFKEIMSDTVISQRTLFPVLFLQQTVVCAREGSTVITAHLQPEILLDIINLFSSELTFELVLAISNLSTTNSRKYAAKAMCQLAQVKELKTNQSVSNNTASNKPLIGTSNQTTGGNATNSGSKTMERATPMLIG